MSFPTTFEDGSDIPRLHLYSVFRFIRRHTSGRLEKLLIWAYYSFTQWYDISFHNLPKTFPTDFRFADHTTGQFRQDYKTSEVIIENGRMILTTTYSRKDCIAETYRNEYKTLKKEHTEYEVSREDQKRLYATIRKTGFLHFLDSGEDEEAMVSSSIELTAHGRSYVFRYTFPHYVCEKNVNALHSTVNEIIKKNK